MTTFRPTLGHCGECRRKLFNPESARAGKCLECRIALAEIRCKTPGCNLILVHPLSRAEKRCIECRAKAIRLWALRRLVYGPTAAPTESLSVAELVLAMKPDR